MMKMEMEVVEGGRSCNQAWEGASKTKAATSLENYCSQIELHSQDPFFRSDDEDERHFSSIIKRLSQNRDPFLVIMRCST